MGIEIMLTAIDLDDEAVLEADEIDDEIVAGRIARRKTRVNALLATKVKSPFFHARR